jgi:phenylacetic acid degradation operon negative regulatory protein
MPLGSQKLVPNAIVRKLDPSLPGINESLEELENVTLPRFQTGFPPQRLTMTLLGDFWNGRTQALPSGALVKLLQSFEINEQTVRVTLGRLVGRGALILERRGRTTWYSQSPNLLALLPQGRAITQNFAAPRTGWDGDWSVVSWNMVNTQAASAHRIRMSLRELGYAPLAPGVWVSADDASDLVAAVMGEEARFSMFTARELPSAGHTAAVTAFDLTAIQSQYEDFLRTFQPFLKSSRTRRFTPADALVARTRAVYRWFVIATLDPDLPLELLPPQWPRAKARELFVTLVNSITPAAASYVRSVVAEYSPDTSELVTTPALYLR